MYRVFNTKEKKWIKDNVYIVPSEDYFLSFEKKWYGNNKVYHVFGSGYVLHRDIGLRDKNKQLIFEGDICSCKGGEFIGVVAYVEEHASYYLLNEKDSTFYPLGTEYRNMIEVIGNVLENQDLLQNEEENEE